VKIVKSQSGLSTEDYVNDAGGRTWEGLSLRTFQPALCFGPAGSGRGVDDIRARRPADVRMAYRVGRAGPSLPLRRSPSSTLRRRDMAS
jgi:hypothetical protein